ncbi:MAG TPA: hypothetical protein PKA00_16050 [Saprospiraceae bacterium]|nr:hypothetical protein [Saprospiraceae bacterium]HMQ84428.1 hypothetical protein [Saprospiraceae bacterium]
MGRMSWGVIPFSLFLLSFAACTSPATEREVQPAFYYWKTEAHLSTDDRAYLQELNCGRLYLRCFDVDWDEEQQQLIPVAPVALDTSTLVSFEVVPVIFITNRSFQHLTLAEVPVLAAKIERKMEQLLQGLPQNQIREWQIDCDWTVSTRDLYFALLEAMKAKADAKGCLLSATIRLHQLRYPEKTGVPPVDRGMLMLYNMGELGNWSEDNSILNLTSTKPYLEGLADYSLPLDMALPLFHWGVVFREGEVVALLPQANNNTLADTARFQQMENKRYQVKTGTFFFGTYLYEGDWIRLEQVDNQQLEQLMLLLKNDFPTAPFYLSFYHLDSLLLTEFKPAQLKFLLEMMENQ